MCVRVTGREGVCGRESEYGRMRVSVGESECGRESVGERE